MQNRRSHSKTSLYKGRHKYGKYIVNPDIKTSDSLIKWITAGDFNIYEKDQFHLSQVKGRPRNKLYAFYLPEAQRETVMKVSHINSRYRLSRKIDLFLTSLYKDYCKISFYGAIALHKHNLPVAEPLAFWTVKQSFFRKKSYFLCDKVPGEQSLSQLLQLLETDNCKNACHTLAKKLIAIMRDIHAANMRHSDFHVGNIHTCFPQSSPAEQMEKLSGADFFLLDYDACSKTRVKIGWIKKIYDLKDLSLLTIPMVSDKELLKIYFNKNPSYQSLRIFRFWKNGGINLRKQLGLSPKKENRHLIH